jgi:hypothetical protein
VAVAVFTQEVLVLEVMVEVVMGAEQQPPAQIIQEAVAVVVLLVQLVALVSL